MSKFNISNDKLTIDEFAEIIEKSCEKYGWKYEEKFGYIYIHTKFESWYFELTNGKLKLMHKNTRYTSCGDYHLQWRKFVTPKYLVYYINSHGKNKYSKNYICA
jgi:hypothetical protein